MNRTPRPALGVRRTDRVPDGLVDLAPRRTLATAHTVRFPHARPHLPPGAAARAEAARLLAGLGGEVTVDLARYAELAEASR